MRLWMICYDIADNRRRTQVAHWLADQGAERTQESVFECWLEPRAATQAGRELHARLQPDDLLTWYRLGREEAHEVRILGLGRPPAEPHGWYA